MPYDQETLARWDREHLWHPFTQMQGFVQEELPIVARGDGPYLYDLQGRRYLDGVSSLWCNVHGHRRPGTGPGPESATGKHGPQHPPGTRPPPAIVLARRLAEIAPQGLTRVFFSDNGSTAVEAALKIAYQYCQLKGHRNKKRFLKLKEGYHGDTLGAVSVGGIDLFHETYRPLLFDTLTAPAPYCYRCQDRENCREECLAEMVGAGGTAPG